MRGKTTFQKAKDQIELMAANTYDETIPVADMTFDSLNKMWISGGEFEVLPSAQRLFANRLRVPHAYLVRCPEDLQAHNLNYWLEQERKKRESLFCRFDGQRLRAVFTDRYKCLDNMDIMQRMVEYGFASDTEVHINMDSELMVLKVPDYTRMFGFDGDRIAPGISVSNSEVGILAFSIEAYFYRLVCTNGLISKTQVASRFRHVSLKALEEFNDIIRQVIHESHYNQERLSLSTETRVDDPLATIGSFNRQFQLTKKEAEAVERDWTYEQGSTMFNVINAYTRAAQDQQLTGEEAHKLERVGGEILALVKR
jgi:hypothetical protein